MTKATLATTLPLVLTMLLAGEINANESNGKHGDLISNEDAVRAITALAGGLSSDHLSEPMRARLTQFLRGTGSSDLNDRANLAKLLLHFAHSMPHESRLHLAGELAQGAKWAAQRASPVKPFDREHDRNNWDRNYGAFVLGVDDPTFDHPKHLARILLSSGQNTNTWRDLGSAHKVFEKAWEAIAPDHLRTPALFALNGSDAISALYDLITIAARERLGSHIDFGEFLTIGTSYVAGRGLGSRHNALFHSGAYSQTSDWTTDDATTTVWAPTEWSDLNRLMPREIRAITTVKRVADRGLRGQGPRLPTGTPRVGLGGVIVEPIKGPDGVCFHRPEFLVELMHFCQKRKLLLIADETLTGMARTGALLGYQHYPGFEPDVVLMGKAMQTGAIALHKRLTMGLPAHATTFEANDATLLTSAQVLQRIAQDNLIENAADVGEYLLHKMRGLEAYFHNGRPTVGKGLFLTSGLEFEGIQRQKRGHRYMPPLDLTRAEVDSKINRSTCISRGRRGRARVRTHTDG